MAELADDALSLNSTEKSEGQEDYHVDGIVADRVLDGKTQYLVKWLDYDLTRCTWEPTESFLEDEDEDPEENEILVGWKHKKQLIIQGTEMPFDVAAWEQEQERLAEATEKRKAARRKLRHQRNLERLAKKRRGSSSSSTSDEGENSSASETLKKRSHVPRRGSVRTKTLKDGSEQSPEPRSRGNSKGTKNAAKRQPRSLEVPKKQDKGQTTVTTENAMISRKSEAHLQKKVKVNDQLTAHPSKHEATAKPTKKSTKSAPSGVRKRVQGSDIFAKKWDAEYNRKKHGLGDSWEKNAGGKDKHVFKNAATQNRFAKHGNLEPNPNVSNLSVYDVRDGTKVSSTSGKTYKSTWELMNEKEKEEKDTAAQRQLGKVVDSASAGVAEDSMFVNSQEARTVEDKSTQGDAGDMEMPDAPPPAPGPGLSEPPDIQARGPALQTDKSNFGNDIWAPGKNRAGEISNAPSGPRERPRPKGSEDPAFAAQDDSRQAADWHPPRGPAAHSRERAEQTDLIERRLEQVIGDLGVRPIATGPREDVSDLYGTLAKEGLSDTMVTFRGLPPAPKHLFFQSKIGPRTLEIRMHQSCSFEEYWTYYHTVSQEWQSFKAYLTSSSKVLDTTPRAIFCLSLVLVGVSTHSWTK